MNNKDLYRGTYPPGTLLEFIASPKPNYYIVISVEKIKYDTCTTLMNIETHGYAKWYKNSVAVNFRDPIPYSQYYYGQKD